MKRRLRLIPAIDLLDGRCVRLRQGDFAAETRYAADPAELSNKYRGYGADWLHVVDLDAARGAMHDNRALVLGLARNDSLRLQVGGGVRTQRAVEELLSAGVARVVVGSAAVTSSGDVCAWLAHFGPERVALAFDVRLDAASTPCVAFHGWQEQSTLSLWSAVDTFAGSGLKHVVCTDVGRDGMLVGPNLELYAEAAGRYPHIQWQASGGIRSATDLAALDGVGAASAISGRALLDELIPLEELRPFLPNA